MSHIQLENPYRILIIDDNLAIHDDFRKILGAPPGAESTLDQLAAEVLGERIAVEHGLTFHIASAFQGHEGLAMIEQALEEGYPYAMAFVDVRMPPGWDGIETIERIWQRYPDLEVVVCTAYTDYSLDNIIAKLGHTDRLLILKKPFDNIEALQLANALTKKWALAQQSKLKFEDLDRMVNERTLELKAANKKLVKEIVEREQAEQALRVSEERFAKAFRASPIPMAIQTVDEERYLDVNENFTVLTGFSREELLGRTATSLGLIVEGEKRNRLLGELRDKRSLRNMASEVRTKSGAIRQTSVSAEVLSLGNQLFSLMITQDMTDRINLESQLRQAQKMEAIGQLASGVAHDFNNILTVIHGHVGLVLATNGLAQEIQSSMREVAGAAERAAALTRQLLAFSRKQVIQRKVLNLNETIRTMESMLRRLIGEHIKIVMDCSRALPPVFADPGHLEQIVMNLAVNARDAMPDGGTLTISTDSIQVDSTHLNPEAQSGICVRLSVSDTGCGMSPEVMARIFEPFFTTKDVGKGTGLGLSTVYGIVKQHAGWIEVSSEAQRGSRFDVFIPCTPNSAAATRPSSFELSVSAGKETILLVEDEPELRHLTALILKKFGYKVLSAANGIEALQVWDKQAEGIDLLLTDMVMPEGLSGRQLAEKLLAERPGLKVLYSSGYSIDLIESDFAQNKDLKLLQKPYAPLQLVRTVRNCLDEVPTT